MPYDKTISYSQRIFEITITSTYTSVYDLLSAPDKSIIDSIRSNGGGIVDGYIISSAGAFSVKVLTGDAVHPVALNEKFLCPVYNWIDHTKLYTASPTAAIVRVFTVERL